jgi:hypothetical protein
VDEIRALAKDRKPGLCESKSVAVAIDAEQGDGVEALEKGFRVAPHPQGGVDDEAAGLERGAEKFDASIE